MTADNSNISRRPTDRSSSLLEISQDAARSACVLTASGILDSRTYVPLRNSVVHAALEQPRAVLVDVNNLDVPAPSAWTVFASARWLVEIWPATPIHLVSAYSEQRTTIDHIGVTRYIPLHRTLHAALDVLVDTDRVRSRARVELPSALSSLRVAREYVARSLIEWGLESLVPVATVIANVFVENVLQHTVAAPVLMLETDGTTVTVALHDDCTRPAVRCEDPIRSGQRITGLAIVASVCRDWGSAPTRTGKTVWAVIGPENRL